MAKPKAPKRPAETTPSTKPKKTKKVNTTKLQLAVQVPDSTPAADKIYVMGNFNDWTPCDPNACLAKAEDGAYTVTLKLPKDMETLEYRFTRGSHETDETRLSGRKMPNRRLSPGPGSKPHQIRVENWRDMHEPVSTVQGDLKIIQVPGPDNGKMRTLRILLPPDYETSTKRYQVVYMMDGQNLFDEATAYGKEWEVDETLDLAFRMGITQGVIVVGIDNACDDRLAEYSPWPLLIENAPETVRGIAFATWLTQTLKPYIDINYRTRKDPQSNGILGSSLGGLIALYTVIVHRDAIGKAAALSPTINPQLTGDHLLNLVKAQKDLGGIRLYMDVGNREAGEPTFDRLDELVTALQKAGVKRDHLVSRIIPEGTHCEISWGVRLPMILLWLLDEIFKSDASR